MVVRRADAARRTGRRKRDQVTALDTSLSFSYPNLAVPNQCACANPAIRDW
jgi:hypothetical protein